MEHPQQRPWFHTDTLCDDALADIVGASPAEIAIMNGLSVNLHLLLTMFYRPNFPAFCANATTTEAEATSQSHRENRYKICMERNAFPSDHHVIQSAIYLAHANFRNSSLAEATEQTLDTNNQDILKDAILYLPGRDPLEDIQDAALLLYDTATILEFLKKHAQEIAILLLPGVQYLTGQVFDIAAITAAAHCYVIIIHN
jgi:kynureninase